MWFSDYMPRTQAAIKTMLSQEFVNAITDPQYHQLTQPIYGVYGNAPKTPTDAPATGPTDAPVTDGDSCPCLEQCDEGDDPCLDECKDEPDEFCDDHDDDDDESEDGSCFSGHTVVDVLHQGSTRMDELKIGDQVRTAQGHYSTVYSFGHRQPFRTIRYLQIWTNASKLPLEISSEHLVFKFDDKVNSKVLVAAEDVKVGDALIDQNGTPTAIVQSIRLVHRQGLYSPLTATGDAVVNGVLASNYVTRSWLKDYVRGGLLLHYLQHGSTVPYRLFCSFMGCHEEVYNNSTGFSPWVQFWYQVEQWHLHRLNPFFRVVFLTWLAIPVAMAIVIGKLLSSASLSATNTIAAVLGYCIILKKSKKSKKMLAEKAEVE